MGELTSDKRTLLRATSIIRGITLNQILELELYRPRITLQSLISNGWLMPVIVRVGGPTPVYFLTERGKRWRQVYSEKSL